MTEFDNVDDHRRDWMRKKREQIFCHDRSYPGTDDFHPHRKGGWTFFLRLSSQATMSVWDTGFIPSIYIAMFIDMTVQSYNVQPKSLNMTARPIANLKTCDQTNLCRLHSSIDISYISLGNLSPKYRTFSQRHHLPRPINFSQGTKLCVVPIMSLSHVLDSTNRAMDCAQQYGAFRRDFSIRHACRFITQRRLSHCSSVHKLEKNQLVYM